MSGNQRIRHARESSLLEIDVSAANFRDFNSEQRRVGFEIRFANFTYLDRRVWFGNDGDEWHDAIEYCIKLSR
jgi:hypothetical protein